MQIPSTLQTFYFSRQKVQAFIPSVEWLHHQMNLPGNHPVPYWAQVWPAAKALCEVLAEEPHLLKNKTVLELAAGLGLPSLLAAQFAKEVTATDFIDDAVEMLQRSANYNGLQNFQCRVGNWRECDANLKPEVLLLSDINYDPKDFDDLYKMLIRFINQNTTIIISTPQRLMAKPFMERLTAWIARTYVKEVPHQGGGILISVWVLKS